MKKNCLSCYRKFKPCPTVKDQKYCSKPKCQKARKNLWRKNKLASDPDYKLNQYDSQKRWSSKNEGYWTNYRESHEEYENRNRALQKIRNLKQKQTSKNFNLKTVIAKSDELKHTKSRLSGYYSLIPINNVQIAKSDELVVKIDVVSNSYLNTS